MVCSPSVVLLSLSTSGIPWDCRPPFMPPQGRCASRIYHPFPACLFTSPLTCLLQLTDTWTTSHGPCLIFFTDS